MDKLLRHEQTGWAFACCLCGSDLMTPIEVPPDFPWVTSDVRPWHSRASLAQCFACGLVQKSTDSTYKGHVADIYASYSLYSADGSYDHLVAGAGGFKARASTLLERLTERGIAFSSSGSVLDYGCGRGAFLQALNEYLPDWSLVGADLTEVNRVDVEKIEGAKYVTLENLSTEQRFDVISLIHVLEHLSTPVTSLNRLSRMLTDDGLLLIQVPNFRENPFDLSVFDHTAHFSVESLENLARISGLDSVTIADGLVPREITMVAKRRSGFPLDVQRPDTPVGELKALDWLSHCRQQAVALESEGVEFGILGTQVGALWFDQISGLRAAFFVDEAPRTDSDKFLGRPVLFPSDVPAGRRVVVPFLSRYAAPIAARLAGYGAIPVLL